MPMEKIQRKIRNRKFLLNLSLKYLSPSNKLIIIISQNLDKYINLYQSNLYKINASNNNFKKSDDITI